MTQSYQQQTWVKIQRPEVQVKALQKMKVSHDKIIEKTSEEITERESDEVITVSETSNEIPGDIIDFTVQTFDADDVRNGSPKKSSFKAAQRTSVY